jgi:sugar transferase (PEP-CTERM/EpsH1 system associated)
MNPVRAPINSIQALEIFGNRLILPLESRVEQGHRLVNWGFILKPFDSNIRVLQFAPRVCWPLDTGAKLRNYHLAKVLAERARVTLLAFTDEAQSPAQLDNVYEQTLLVRRERGYTTAKLLQGALGRTPLPLLNYTTDSMKRELERVLNEQDFDIVQVESIHLMAYLPIIRTARSRPLTVCDWHNIESELMRRYSECEPNILKRAYAGRTAKLMSQFERRAMSKFDAHTAVSHRDAEQLRTINPDARVFIIENGVDTAYYSDDRKDSARGEARPAGGLGKPNRIVFVASMDYHANIDGAVSFARDVWPALHERHPELVFTIVGRDPAPEVRTLATGGGIEVTGTVNDVRPFYREAIAAVVPLRVGGGSRLKILEAMAAGVPVVSTALGAEGLDLHNGEDILIADTNEQLAEAIGSLVGNKEDRQRLSVAGRALVSERYDWSRLGMNLFETYRQLLAT